jgi:alanyl-tRNA synthetase
MANEIVAASLPVEFLELPREEAEKRYGFLLYQGGAPAGATIRVVRVGDFDSEACGGTHVRTTGEVGLIKVTHAERIQDGVVRLEYSASIAALEVIQKLERQLMDSAAELSVPPDQLPKTVKRFFEEWKEQKKEIEALRSMTAKEIANKHRNLAEHYDNYYIVTIRENINNEMAKLISRDLVETPNNFNIILSKLDNNIILSSGKNVDVDLGNIIIEFKKKYNVSGGGKNHFAQLTQIQKNIDTQEINLD